MKLLKTVQSFFPQRSHDPADVLTAIVHDVAQMDGFRFEQFAYYLNIYQSTRTTVLSRKPNSAAEIEQLRDCCDTIRVFLEGFHCKSVDLLCFEIEALFSHQYQAMAA
jgi:hypothetical protein